MAQYSLTIENVTTNPWHIAIYQTFPDFPGLSSIAWQIAPLPKQNPGTPPPGVVVHNELIESAI